MQKTHKKLIALLVGLNLLNYIDRYLLSAISPSLQRDLGFTDAQLGLIGSAFLWGFVLATPFVGKILKKFSPLSVLAVSVLLWSSATASTGFVRLVILMVIIRMVVGIGQAVFSTASPAILDSVSDKKWKALAMSMFYAAIPVGAAMGFIIGGLVDVYIGWQMGFVLAGAVGIPLALVLHFYPISTKPKRGYGVSALQEYKQLIRLPVFNLIVLGNAAQSFALAGFAFWVPLYLTRIIGYPASEGSILFGEILVVTGLLGTLLGGYVINKFKIKDGSGLMRLSAYSVALAGICGFLVIMTDNVWTFFIMLAIVQFSVFITYTPTTLALFAGVPAALKTSANSASMFTSRLLGDMLGVWLVGVLSVALNGLADAMYILPFALVLSSLLWSFAASKAKRKNRS